MFHWFRPDDPAVSEWAGFRDYVLTEQFGLGVSPTTLAGEGFTDAQWARLLDPRDDYSTTTSDSAAATAFATRVNAVTAANRSVVVEQPTALVDLIPMLDLTLPLLTKPASVHFTFGSERYASYEVYDLAAGVPLVSDILELGCGVLCPMFVPQAVAELSGDIVGFIDRWFRGPGDGRLPYLLALRKEMKSSSPVRFIVSVVDRLFSDERLAQLPTAQFLDLILHRAAVGYPEMFNFGVGTRTWDSDLIQDANRASDMASLLRWYSTGGGAASGGRRRFYAAAVA